MWGHWLLPLRALDPCRPGRSGRSGLSVPGPLWPALAAPLFLCSSGLWGHPACLFVACCYLAPVGLPALSWLTCGLLVVYLWFTCGLLVVYLRGARGLPRPYSEMLRPCRALTAPLPHPYREMLRPYRALTAALSRTLWGRCGVIGSSPSRPRPSTPIDRQALRKEWGQAPPVAQTCWVKNYCGLPASRGLLVVYLWFTCGLLVVYPLLLCFTRLPWAPVPYRGLAAPLPRFTAIHRDSPRFTANFVGSLWGHWVLSPLAASSPRAPRALEPLERTEVKEPCGYLARTGS